MWMNDQDDCITIVWNVAIHVLFHSSEVYNVINFTKCMQTESHWNTFTYHVNKAEFYEHVAALCYMIIVSDRHWVSDVTVTQRLINRISFDK